MSKSIVVSPYTIDTLVSWAFASREPVAPSYTYPEKKTSLSPTFVVSFVLEPLLHAPPQITASAAIPKSLRFIRLVLVVVG